MLEHDGPSPLVPAGQYPPQLLDACRLWQVSPDALMGWSVSHVAVTLVLPSGQKVGVSVGGTWRHTPQPGVDLLPVDPVAAVEQPAAEARPKPARQRKPK